MDILKFRPKMHWVDAVKQSLINTPIQQVLFISAFRRMHVNNCPNTSNNRIGWHKRHGWTTNLERALALSSMNVAWKSHVFVCSPTPYRSLSQGNKVLNVHNKIISHTRNSRTVATCKASTLHCWTSFNFSKISTNSQALILKYAKLDGYRGCLDKS